MPTPIRTPGQRAEGEAGKADAAKAAPKRINVAVNPETMAALQKVMDRENVSLTEAVRRLVGYGEVLYRAVREDDEELLLKRGTTTRQVIIL
ncbi:hypothetical protein DMC64_02550 [Amycolatopsis sp. WAC 04197]|uniref:hypothetical protein n=1 Tax=Amycolatopsis sp. WAC 04197 TaxID=2203199 RepID=UPI000F787570|nr:hypothetical protein [Amycolatopsis sp. WAC 04197]RSN49463.1 hypothetical protein DMC64_02550 [Amycolatopsis sp. WAC 04197]